jgi:hypothetical protein
MDRWLLVKGKILLQSWEDLSLARLYSWIVSFFPVAFTENEHGEFGAYPTNIFCRGKIVQSEIGGASQVLNSDFIFTLGWDASIDNKYKNNALINELYFSILPIDDHLREKGFRLNTQEEKIWTTRIKQAKQAALSLNDEYSADGRTNISLECYKLWLDYVDSISLRPTIRLSLMILLKSFCGMSNAELQNEFSRASISRYKATAKSFIANNFSLFSQLPRLPL